ncbi:hypothetical protein ACHAXH_006689, partial [Discostella pseudostelligera]
MQPVINELIKFSIRQSPHRRIKFESAWEKQHLAWVKKHLSKQLLMVEAERLIQLGESDIPTLRGWFLKEKHESFKKRQGFLSGYSCNRRWFTIERAPKSGDDGSSDELLLCYYKLSSAELGQCCGWLFLNDITSLTQDLPNRWITIEHPTRVIRIQSPTPAQHRVWFYTLSKCCKNAKKYAASPPSLSATGDRRPSLPYFSEIATQKIRMNSLKFADDPIAGTPKDELEFLRDITGGTTAEVEEVRQNMNLFRGASFSTFAEDVGMIDGNDGEDDYDEVIPGKFSTVNFPGAAKIEETSTHKSFPPSHSSSKSETSGTSPTAHLDQIAQLSSAMNSIAMSPELAKPTKCKLLHDIEGTVATSLRSSRVGDRASRVIHDIDHKPDVKDLRAALSNVDSQRCLKKQPPSIAKSSTYQVHF